jgi:archaellum component FlaC
MSDQPSELILVMLRRLDQKVDRLIDDVQDLKQRMTSVERQLGEVRVDMAGLSGRMDRIEMRLDRMERRLDIATAE